MILKKNVMNITAAALLCAAVAASFAGCSGSGSGGTENAGEYAPSVEITGDVENVFSFTPDGEGVNAGKETPAVQAKYNDGWRIADLVSEASPYAEDSTAYIQGWDGMMASIAVEELDENWLTFGKNGWECVNDGYQDSLSVKGIRRIIVVADDPSEVPSSVKATAEDGIERTVSPGSLCLKDTVSSVIWQGESSKNDSSVSVWLTDQYAQIGDTKLKADGNKIVTE